MKQTNTRWNELCLINTWPGDYKRWASHLLLTLSIYFPFFLLLIIISNHTICLVSKNICSASAKTMVTVMTFLLFVCMFIYLFASNRINEPERPMKINWQDKWRKKYQCNGRIKYIYIFWHDDGTQISDQVCKFMSCPCNLLVALLFRYCWIIQ